MTGQQITSSYIGVSTYNGLAPVKGPRVLQAQLDFSVQSSYVVDMSQAQELDRVEFIQGMYADNSANSSPLIVTIPSLGFSVTYPAYSQGFIPIPSPNPPRITLSTATSNVINVEFFTFPVPAEVWQVAQLPTPGTTGLDHSANAPTLEANLIATAPANPNRSLLGYQNQSANFQQLVMDSGTGTQQTILLFAPGASANSPGGSYIDVAFKGRARVYSTSSTDQCALYER